MFRLVDEDQVEGLLNVQEALGILEKTYISASAGMADVSAPAAMHLRGDPETGLAFKIKGAVLDGAGVSGLRIIADLPGPGSQGHAYVYLADSRTGAPVGMVSELYLHRLRTALTGLVACKALAAPGVRRFALIGTGRIAEEFVKAIHEVFPEAELVVASRSAVRAEATAKRWQALTPNALRHAGSVAEAVAGAEVVVTLSDAAETLFNAQDVAPGTLICAMGGRHEFDRDILDLATEFIVDEIDFVCSAGNAAHWIETSQISRDQVEARVDARIGDVLSGKYAPRRKGVTLAIIQGMAICDLALAKKIIELKD